MKRKFHFPSSYSFISGCSHPATLTSLRSYVSTCSSPTRYNVDLRSHYQQQIRFSTPIGSTASSSCSHTPNTNDRTDNSNFKTPPSTNNNIDSYSEKNPFEKVYKTRNLQLTMEV